MYQWVCICMFFVCECLSVCLYVYFYLYSCMFVYVWVYMFECMRVSVKKSVCEWEYASRSIRAREIVWSNVCEVIMWVSVYLCMNVFCIYDCDIIYLFMYICSCLYFWFYLRMYLCMYVCNYGFMYVYTNTLT